MEKIVYQKSPPENTTKQPGMRFQERDGELLMAIYQYDGVLAKRQLKEMFWKDKSWRAFEKRLAKLHNAGYLNWPTSEERRIRPISEPICWLGWRGILWVAGMLGVQVKPPSNPNENQLRTLEKRLRDQGIYWNREPRWSQLIHDLSVVDIRMAVERAAGKLSHLTLEEWVPEGMFLTNMDVIDFTVRGKDGKERMARKGVRPDGFFSIVDENRLILGEPARQRFLLELDHATSDTQRFGREKAAPGLAYIRSEAYKERFQYNSGRWLVITTGITRMQHLIYQTKRFAGAGAHAFLFSIFEKALSADILTEPIWWQPGSQEPRSLFVI
jgi:hypothetical protein